ncbi:vitamin K epoxide reductase family protein [Candidatus Microgenomates bacterium]|nr:vitamin K epoxide reductase family protein [Candidatus Microgenomates bacterium]
MKKTNWFLIFNLLLITAGIWDTVYLTYEHFANIIPPCPAHSVLGSFVDCGRVLQSSYATILGFPVALIGLGYYIFLLVILRFKPKLMLLITPMALLASLYFLYLQLFVIKAICIYCTFSGLINLVLFILTWSTKLFSTLKQKNSSLT